jgi:restriction system protein
MDSHYVVGGVDRMEGFVPIPDFQTLMHPLLVHVSDGKEHPNQETLKSLSEHFQLTDEELAQLLPSGLQSIFTNRIAWVKSHLKAADLSESNRHARCYRFRNLGIRQPNYAI